MKIKYTLKEVRPNIFAVIVPNDYDRAMLFCRVQEFYESDSNLFKEQDFDMWEYMRWYSAKNNGVFTYTKDWDGFNIKLVTALNCIIGVKNMTSYDKIMHEIINQILLTNHPYDVYMIGVKSETCEAFKHELCHALYNTNKEYKILADGVSAFYISENTFFKLAANLEALGYNKDVVPDEIQAYMMTNYKSKYFRKGVDIDELTDIHNKYKEQLNHFLK
jgi:hypothetical protein